MELSRVEPDAEAIWTLDVCGGLVRRCQYNRSGSGEGGGEFGYYTLSVDRRWHTTLARRRAASDRLRCFESDVSKAVLMYLLSFSIRFLSSTVDPI